MDKPKPRLRGELDDLARYEDQAYHLLEEYLNRKYLSMSLLCGGGAGA